MNHPLIEPIRETLSPQTGGESRVRGVASALPVQPPHPGPLPWWGRGRKFPWRRLVLLLLVTTALAGCGRKGAPLPPPNVPNTYPRTYPSE